MTKSQKIIFSNIILIKLNKMNQSCLYNFWPKIEIEGATKDKIHEDVKKFMVFNFSIIIKGEKYLNHFFLLFLPIIASSLLLK